MNGRPWEDHGSSSGCLSGRWLAILVSVTAFACDDAKSEPAGKDGGVSEPTSVELIETEATESSEPDAESSEPDAESSEPDAESSEPAESSSAQNDVVAPSANWVNATGNLAGMVSECGNLTLISAVPSSDRVLAGVAKVGLFASDDGGAHWAPLGSGDGSAAITNRPSSIIYDPLDPSLFWESGIYNGGGVYKTTSAGEAFEQLGQVSHNDLVSVDFSDPERKTLLVGGHEQKQTLYLSTDGGESFAQIGMNLPSDSHFSSLPLVLDATTFLLGTCGYGDGQCGVYRSTNAGQDWSLQSELPVQAAPLWASDGTIYWTTQYDSGIARSTDGGLTWEKTADGIVTATPIELPDGRILALQGDHVALSDDGAASWEQVGEPLPFKPNGIAYSRERKELYVSHWDCGEVVLDDAIVSAGFDPAEH